MTEETREKVILGLEWCMCKKHDCYREKGCPYENECDDVGCKYALHRDALALLKAQEPVEPTIDIRHGKSMWRCGSCSTALQPNQMHAKFCFNCGKAVRWE